MPILLIGLFGSAIFGNAFFKIGTGSLTVLNFLIVVSCITYLTAFIANRKGLVRYDAPNKGDNLLWAFCFLGLAVVGLSYAGLYSAVGVTGDLLINASFIPRQAYYLFFIPLVILAGRSKSALSCLVVAKKNYRQFFVFVYLAYVAAQGTVALDVPVCFCLSILLLMSDRRDTVIDIFFLCLVLFSPIRVGGEMTQMIMRLVLVASYFFGGKAILLRVGVGGAICIVLVCYALPFVPLDYFDFDANTIWRAQYWHDELSQLINSYGLGVGYGTSYATSSFVGSAISGPFAATAGYSATERLFVVGCHNSFVSLAFRLGIIGVALLITYLAALSHRDENYYKEGYASSASFALIASIIIVCFNVGFENPTYFFLFALSIVLVNSAGKALSESCIENGSSKSLSLKRRSIR